jgi:PIN domain nuclease of toxin-antitoxin system
VEGSGRLSVRSTSLAGEHRDPFDRILIAQAKAVNQLLVSSEKLFDGYGVQRLWCRLLCLLLFISIV